MFEPDETVQITRRQQDVLQLLAQGLSNAQIAEVLTLSPGSVANYVEALLHRTGALNRVQLATWATLQQQKEHFTALLRVLERIQAIPPGDLRSVLTAAAQAFSEGFGADKADAFLVDTARQQLVALGTSRTPMGKRQHALELNLLPLDHAGRIGQVFLSGQPHRDGHVDQDGAELLAVRQDLGVRSTLAVPLRIDGEICGVLVLNPSQSDAFAAEQLQLLGFGAQWVSLLVQANDPAAPGDEAPD